MPHDEIGKFFEKLFWNNNSKHNLFLDEILGKEKFMDSRVLKFTHFHDPNERR